ncbi:hypothetical protein E2P81_ATG01698 [Venturia nashicola]|nr:hypothetical protein E2P81_ATG01698 [Venturia nashicola]
MLLTVSLILSLLTTTTTAELVGGVCPGYNFAVWHSGAIDFDGNKQYGVVGSDCGKKTETAICPAGNPCTCSSLTCTSAPATINGFISHENLWYHCLQAKYMGSCDFFLTSGYAIESCCRNNGHKNKERGVINDEQFEVINATNTLLNRHLEEYESTLKKRGGEVKLVRARHMHEMNEAMKREMETGLKAWSE